MKHKTSKVNLAQFLLYLTHLKTSYYNTWFWRYSCQNKNSDLLEKMVKVVYSLDQNIFMLKYKQIRISGLFFSIYVFCISLVNSQFISD